MKDAALFVIDLDRCWGCRTCETACGIEKGVSPPGSGISVHNRESSDSGTPRRIYLPVVCLQCESAQCMAACPTDALRRNPDGTVSVIADECIGCGKCESACPYGAIVLDRHLSVAVKCDMCVERRDAGGNPMCVHHCIGGALSVLSESDYESLQASSHTLRQENLVYTSRTTEFGSPGGSK